MRVEPQQLKSFLLDAGLITAEQFDQALEKTEKTKQAVESVLITDHLISEENLIKLSAYILGPLS